MKYLVRVVGIVAGMALIGVFLWQLPVEERVGTVLEGHVGLVPPNQERGGNEITASMRGNESEIQPGEKRLRSDLGGLAKKHGISLSPEDAEAAQRIFDDMTTERRLLEVARARVTIKDEHNHRIEIPSYAEEGRRMKVEFETALGNELGREKADLFLQRAGLALSDRMNNWGAEDQLIDVTYVPEAALYQITHAVGLVAGRDHDGPVRVSVSALRETNLLQYSFLKPLLPGSK